jgi:Ran GTPase-activating protein (RanGAP) involved in mRNA processing and transport
MEMSRRIFEGKCRDMGIAVSPAREQRFLAMAVLRGCGGTRLDLSNKELGEHAFAEIAAALRGDEHYLALCVAGNAAKDAGAGSLADMLRANTTLTECDLRSNDIGVRGACELFRALEASPTVTAVDLSGMSGINRNHIGVRGAQAVAAMLQRNQVIWKLCLQENGLGAEGVAALVQGLAQNGSLGYLDLASNALGPQGSVVLAGAIPECKVATLVLARNFIDDGGLAAITEALRKVNSVAHLDVSDNGLGPKSGKCIADAVRAPACLLQTLVLSDNVLGDGGLRYLAEALKETRGIQELVICRNRITGKSVVDLANGLKYNRSLRRLDLSGNKLGDEGAVALVEPLCMSTCAITHLLLGSCSIGDPGGTALARVILENERLISLDLRNNFLMEAAAEALGKAVLTNATLLYIDVSLNDFAYKSFDAIERKVAENRRIFRSSTLYRFEQAVSALTEGDSELSHVRRDLEEVRDRRAKIEAVMEETIRTLEQTEEKCREEQKSWQERLITSTRELNKTELQKIEVEKAISAAKVDRERAYKALIAKLHHEKETKARIELRVIVERRNADETLAALAKDNEQLDSAHKAAIAERDSARHDVEELRKRVIELAAIVAKASPFLPDTSEGPMPSSRSKQLPKTASSMTKSGGSLDPIRKKTPATATSTGRLGRAETPLKS